MYLLLHGKTPVLVADSLSEARAEAEKLDGDAAESGEYTALRFDAERLELDAEDYEEDS